MNRNVLGAGYYVIVIKNGVRKIIIYFDKIDARAAFIIPLSLVRAKFFACASARGSSQSARPALRVHWRRVVFARTRQLTRARVRAYCERELIL